MNEADIGFPSASYANCSYNVPPIACTAPPSIWPATSIGLMAWPTS